MSPDVIARKIASMSKYLSDLLPYKEVSFEDFMKRHYEIERLLELLIMNASDIVLHLISQKEESVPITYRASFLRAGELGIIDNKLSSNLAHAAGLRNILVHEYEDIDYQLLYKTIPVAIRDFSDFIHTFITP